MIIYNKETNIFQLNTKDTTYSMGLLQTGHLAHLYYGKRLNLVKSIEDFFKVSPIPYGQSTIYNNESNLDLNLTPLEIATVGKGDYKEPSLQVQFEDGYTTLDLVYDSHEIIKELEFKDLPQTPKKETLAISMIDKTFNLKVILYYSVFFQEDMIVRNLQVINDSVDDIILDKVLSMNLDFQSQNYDLITLDGAWIRERHLTRRILYPGIVKIDSKKGVSSSDHNPFFAICSKDSSERLGDVYGFNLIYSGNFEANIEVNPHHLLRINYGINSFDFKWRLKSKETFTTPEVIMTYSGSGFNKMTESMHDFINKKISKNDDLRPIMMNNWEATYFDFNEKKLMAIAKKSKKLGIEGFCLDDGWFGRRDNDMSSLGDWQVNQKKLPKGIRAFSKRIKRLGLLFGLWVEPEMVNPDSDLFRRKPEWVMMHPKTNPSLGRNQLVLDLSKDEVVEYLYTTLENVFDQAQVDYVKWDMNRNLSDIYSQSKKRDDQGKLNHSYVLGLYRLLSKLKERFPHVLFESCSSGGNRFDLGMHYYMPQAWTSDNTDAYERMYIQEGSSLAYPLSTISNHVSSNVSHQVLRKTPLESRFNVACFGILGYELDVRKLTPFERKTIESQISFYKEYKEIFQYGKFYQLTKNDDHFQWQVISKDNKTSIVLDFYGLNKANPGKDILKLRGLDKNKKYHISARQQNEDIRQYGDLTAQAMPIKIKATSPLFAFVANRYIYKTEKFTSIVQGDILMQSGVNLHPRFLASGHHSSLRIMPDFGSRLYVIREVE